MAWKHPTVEERGADGCRSVNNRETRWEVDPGIGHRKKSLDLVDLSQSQKQQLVEALRTDYSIRQVCDTLGLNRSSLYYEPKRDAPEEILREEIERLAARYPKYGNHRRITKLLLRMGYTVGYRRVARLMKADNLSVAVKRVSCQTTESFDRSSQWVNRLDTLDICQRN